MSTEDEARLVVHLKSLVDVYAPTTGAGLFSFKDWDDFKVYVQAVDAKVMNRRRRLLQNSRGSL